MSKGFLFFCCSSLILLLSAINISIGPIVSRKVGVYSRFGGYWGSANCEYWSDQIEDKMDDRSAISLKYEEEWIKNECYRKKAMYNMEYTSFIFNIVIGFVCGLLGLLHQLGLKPQFISKTGLIGLGCGVIGFALSFVYVIYNGIVYTNYYDNASIYKRDKFGAFAELNDDKYKCYYFEEPGNKHSIIAKYSDLRKKQYNYDKELFDSYKSPEVQHCQADPQICLDGEEITDNGLHMIDSTHKCRYLFVNSSPDLSISNKDMSDRFLTALILSLLVSLANIVLIILGFLLFKTPDDSFVIKFDTNTNTNTKI